MDAVNVTVETFAAVCAVEATEVANAERAKVSYTGSGSSKHVDD